MSAADFEARYRADPDPWDYCTSNYERDKYAATLAACGAGPFRHALELGSSIGVLSRQLAPRCHHLTTLDFSPTAVDGARARLTDLTHIEVLLGTIPADIPPGTYDLVLASEILYYLPDPALAGTLRRLEATLSRGGRLVAVHWRPSGPDRPRDAAATHAVLQAQPWLAHVGDTGTDQYLLDVWRRR